MIEKKGCRDIPPDTSETEHSGIQLRGVLDI